MLLPGRQIPFGHEDIGPLLFVLGFVSQRRRFGVLVIGLRGDFAFDDRFDRRLAGGGSGRRGTGGGPTE